MNTTTHAHTHTDLLQGNKLEYGNKLENGNKLKIKLKV